MGEELLASQPTISRLENRITKQEIKRIRLLGARAGSEETSEQFAPRFFVDKFLQNYPSAPEENYSIFGLKIRLVCLMMYIILQKLGKLLVELS